MSPRRCSLGLPKAAFSAAATILLLVVEPAAAVDAGLFQNHKWQSGIQVWQSSSKGRGVMWGQCRGWFRKMRSCIMQETTCAAHLSPGPADADIEVQIGNLPVFRNHETYLQWWAARKSKEAYDPVTDPEGAQVYPSMFEAYPRFSDADFNGGNVRINPDGTAVIRFRAPATHQVHKYTRMPHVHLRICSGGNSSLLSIILGRKDKIQLTPQGPVAKSECNSAENKLSVLSFHRLQHDFASASAPFVAVAAAAALKPLVARGVGRLVGRMAEQLDLDALEFSPVFQCLSAGLLYDHFAGDCVAACPTGAAVSRGQCVKPAAVRSSSFAASWQLYICGCDEKCWADKRNGTLHHLRLEIADHLDIPLHEVQELDLRFESRSLNPHQAALARMHIRISSPRYAEDTGIAMLRSLFRGMEGSSEALAMLVLGVREIFAGNSGFLQKHIGTVGISNEDAFAPYYEDLAMAKAASSNDDPWPAEETVAPPLAPGSSFAVGGMLAALAAFTLPGLIILTIFGKCCRDNISVEAGEPTLRHLGEPLAAGENAQQPHATMGTMAAPCDDTSGRSSVASPAFESGNLVPAYLAAVYARALQ